MDQTSLETVTDSVCGKLINWYYYHLDKSDWEEVVSEDSASTDSVNLISDIDSEEEVDCGLQMDQLAAVMVQLAVAQQRQVEAQERIAQQQMEAQERMGQMLFQRQAVDNLNKFRVNQESEDIQDYLILFERHMVTNGVDEDEWV